MGTGKINSPDVFNERYKGCFFALAAARAAAIEIASSAFAPKRLFDSVPSNAIIFSSSAL